MALPMNHIALRAQKSLALFQGAPVYENLPSFSAPESSARTSQYDPTGRYFAYATLTTVVVADAQTGAVVRELAVSGAVELSFSAKGTYLSSWERYSKPADENAQHQNLRVFSVESGKEVMGFTQKGQENWQPSFTPSESHLIRHNSNSSEILLFPTPLSPSTQPSSRLKVEGLKSIWAGGGTEGEGLAVFVGEKNGAPAQLSLYSMQTLRGATPVPTARKNFFKADKISVRWNKAGTMVLFLTQTDVDKTNQNYYGETNLYLLALRGGFECRVALDKEGPIHDYGWNPNSREFGVVYGYMPAKAVLFDTKANPAHDLGLSPRNYINFQPQGRFFLLAGFGNLSGTIDVWDRKSMKKVAQISAPNASACEWSPCGSFIMTATLSPRLRVDNGFKIWYVGGQLLASEAINDLYQALWRPMPSAPDFPAAIPPCPAFSASVSSLPPPPPKPVAAGAYRPPGARAAGTSTPSIFLREDQGGAPSSGPPGAPAYAANGGKANGGRRNVPGYVPKEDGAQAPKKGKKGKKDGRNGQGDSQPQTPTTELAPPLAHFPAVPAAAAPAAEVADVDPIAKKVRNLSKKLKAIDDLKEKLAKGEKLEATQVLKIKSEGAIRLELAALEK